MNNEQDEEELQIDDQIVDKNELKLLQEKEHKIDIQLIIKTSIDQDIVDQMNEDQKYHQNQIETGFPYERQNYSFGIPQYKKLRIWISLIDYRFYSSIMYNYYFKENKIQKIENLETLIRLEYLSLKHNEILILEGLQTNKQLAYLDVSFNKIQLIQYQQIPNSIELLHYNNNPISKSIIDRQKLLKLLPYIDEIDDTPVSREERFHALEIFPNELQQYQERMNQRKKDKNSRVQRIQDIFDNEKLKLPKDVEVDEEDDDLTENSIKQLQEKTQQLVKRSKESMKQQIQEINKDVEEYRELHIKIREQIHENSLNNKYKNQ